MNEFIIIILLILLNGVLAMSEIALISVRKSYLSNEVKNGSRTAKVALKIVNEPERFLSMIQIGITVIGILTGIYSGNVLASNLSEVLKNYGVSVTISHPIAQFVIVILVTYFTLIFGELVPKRIGMNMAEKAVKIVAPPMYFLLIIMSPFVSLLAKSTSFFIKLLGFQTNALKVTEEEIKSMINEGAKEGEVQEVEENIVKRVFLLGDLKVSSLMVYRSDLISIDVNMKNSEIKEKLQANLYELYPVIDKSFDNIKGVVMLQDIMFQIHNDTFDIRQAIKPALYFHENMSVYRALERLKKEGVKYALICDEFGSCQGMISLKDILEGLVGNIEDIHKESDIIQQKNCNEWLVDGQCALYDFLSYFEMENLHSGDNDFNTVGGLVLNQLEHIPENGECTSWKNFKFEIVDMDGARINKILVRTV